MRAAAILERGWGGTRPGSHDRLPALGNRLVLMSRLPVDEYDVLGAFERMILIFIGTASANMAGYGHVPQGENRRG
jgi:hypothetical protein